MILNESNNTTQFLPAVLPAATQFLGSAFNAYTQGRENRKMREYNTQMYDKQKADNIEFWNMQNTYNSPQEQMKRLQEAGLNPNMVYGNGSAISPAGKVSEPTSHPYKGVAPQIDIPNVVDSFFNIQAKQAQVNNMRKQGDLMDLDKASKILENDLFQATLHERKNRFLYESGSKEMDWRNKLALYKFNTGDYSLDNQSFKENSRYFLDLQSARAGLNNNRLLGLLRGSELDIKKLNYQNLQKYGTPKLAAESKLAERIADPSLSGMSFKDWLHLILGGIRAVK